MAHISNHISWSQPFTSTPRQVPGSEVADTTVSSQVDDFTPSKNSGAVWTQYQSLSQISTNFARANNVITSVPAEASESPAWKRSADVLAQTEMKSLYETVF